MKVRVNKKEFEKGLRALKPIAPNNSSLNILHNIVLQTEKDRLSLIASNTFAMIKYYVPAEIIEDGRIIVPANDIIYIVHNSIGKVLTIEGNEKMAKIEDENGCSTLEKLADIQDFLDLDMFSKENYSQGTEINIAGSTLKELLSVDFAAAQDSDYCHRAMQGILLRFAPDCCQAVATNGYQLAVKTCEGVNTKELIEIFLEDFNISPLKNIAEGDIVLIFTPRSAMFKSDKGILLFCVVKVDFPDWQSVIPTDYKESVRTSRNYLLNALVKCAPVAGKDYRKLIKFAAKENKCVLSAKFDSLTVSQEIPCLTSEEFDLNFNVYRLRDGVESVKTDELSISYIGEDKPVVITPVGQDDYIYLLMPIKV